MDPSQVQAPASPLGSFPEIANMYRSSFQLPLSNANVASQNVQDQTTLANQKADQQAAQEQQKVLSDPSNYRVIPRNDGGYGFYDPTGKEISAADYAAVTGKTPQEVLKNSQNPIDIGFQKDWKDLQSYGNLKLQSSTDKAAADKVAAIEADVKKNTGYDLSKMQIGDVINKFMQAYPTVFGQGGFQGAGTAGVKAGTTFIPQATNSFTDQYFPGGAGLGTKISTPKISVPGSSSGGGLR